MYCYVKLKAKDEVFPGGAVKTIKEKKTKPQAREQNCLTLPRSGGMQPYSLFWNIANIS